MDNGFAFTEKKAVCTEASYTTTDGTCRLRDEPCASPKKVSLDTRTCPLTTSRL